MREPARQQVLQRCVYLAPRTAVHDTLCGTKVLFKRDDEKIAANRDYFGDFDPFGDGSSDLARRHRDESPADWGRMGPGEIEGGSGQRDKHHPDRSMPRHDILGHTSGGDAGCWKQHSLMRQGPTR